MLACEWLQKRRLFGIKAEIGEMAKFKSKIKRDEDIAAASKTQQKKAEKKKEDL